MSDPLATGAAKGAGKGLAMVLPWVIVAGCGVALYFIVKKLLWDGPSARDEALAETTGGVKVKYVAPPGSELTARILKPAQGASVSRHGGWLGTRFMGAKYYAEVEIVNHGPSRRSIVQFIQRDLAGKLTIGEGAANVSKVVDLPTNTRVTVVAEMDASFQISLAGVSVELQVLVDGADRGKVTYSIY